MRQKVLCSECFSNAGLRTEARSFGEPADEPCVNCLSRAGTALGEGDLDKLITRFFVDGSRSPYNPPIYKINPSGADERFEPVLFDETLRDDYQLIGRNFAKLHYHAPRLTWMGYGDTYWAFEEALKEFDHSCDKKALVRVTSEILDRCDQIRLQPKQKLYRIRTNPASIVAPQDIDTPPSQTDPSKARSGRFDAPGFPVLYACSDVETALHETRVKLGDEIVLGTLEVLAELTLIDLDEVKVNVVGQRNINADCHYFLRARLGSQETADYRKLQLLAVEALACGFAGLKFQSFYSALRQDRQSAINYALFGYPIREGKLALKSWNSVRLVQASYQFQFGPLLHTLWDRRR
jgi:hypothetical protein